GWHGTADLLLGPLDCALGCGVLHGQALPGMERQPVRWRPGRPSAAPPCARRCASDRRGETAVGSRRAHPRRAAGTRWRPVAAYGSPGRTRATPDSPVRELPSLGASLAIASASARLRPLEAPQLLLAIERIEPRPNEDGN